LDDGLFGERLDWRMHTRIQNKGSSKNNNNNNNTNDNVYGAVIATQSLREFTRFIWRTQTSARWPTLRPDQPTWAASPPVGCYMAYICHRHFSITQLEKLILILPSHVGEKISASGGATHQRSSKICRGQITVEGRYAAHHSTAIDDNESGGCERLSSVWAKSDPAHRPSGWPAVM